MNAENRGPQAFFTEDHRRCDELWAELEAAGGGPEAREAWQAFDQAMRQHFAMEEQVLFPAIEEASGMGGMGPTQVMRMEHVQMRGLLDQMAAAAERDDFDAVLDQGDTLLMLIQQHNVKEENVLYPLAEQTLARQWQPLAERLRTCQVS